MKRVVLLCDVCHNEMNASGKRFKIKYREPDTFMNWDCWEHSKWHKFEMCDDCMQKFQERIIKDKIMNNIVGNTVVK